MNLPLANTGRRILAFGRLGMSANGLLVANAGVLYIYLAYGLTTLQLVLVFWCECVWIGVFSALKLVTASVIGNPYGNRWADVSIGAALFFSAFVIFLASSSFFSLVGVTLIAILFANDIAFVALLPALANTAAFGLLAIVLKELIDLRLHIRERKAFATS
jgi:hypothetical protein